MSFSGPKQHFKDMLKAIALIEQFLGDMDFAAYEADIKTQAAVERELQIVTEAAYRLKPEDEPLCPGPDWRQMRAMGNVLRHAYDRIHNDAIWRTIQEDLPPLKQAVTNALEMHFPSADQ
jgi:uncharacterized protein with HEPN domain